MLDETLHDDQRLLETPEKAESMTRSRLGNVDLSTYIQSTPNAARLRAGNDADSLGSTAEDAVDTVDSLGAYIRSMSWSSTNHSVGMQVRTKVAKIETRIGRGGLGTIDSCATTREFLRRSSVVRNSLDEMFKDSSPRLTRSEGSRTTPVDPWIGSARRISLCAADSSSESEMFSDSEDQTPSPSKSRRLRRRGNLYEEPYGGIHTMYESAFDLDWSSEPHIMTHDVEPSSSTARIGYRHRTEKCKSGYSAHPARDDVSETNASGKQLSMTNVSTPSVDIQRRPRLVQLRTLSWSAIFALLVVLICSLMILAYYMGMRRGLQEAGRCSKVAQSIRTRSSIRGRHEIMTGPTYYDDQFKYRSFVRCGRMRFHRCHSRLEDLLERLDPMDF